MVSVVCVSLALAGDDAKQTESCDSILKALEAVK